MKTKFQHLGSYNDIVGKAHRQGHLHSRIPPGKETQEKVRQALGWNRSPEALLNVKIEKRWESDGIAGEQLSRSAGYGPPTQTWVFKPIGSQGSLPAVLALHNQVVSNTLPKEKIADGAASVPQFMLNKRAILYDSRSWENALAKEGFTVLVHTAFL